MRALSVGRGEGMVSGGGRDRVGGRYYTPLYQNGIKEVRIKSMETTHTKSA